MKNAIFYLFVVVAMITTSCKKDHVCTCTYTSTAPGSTSFTYDVTVKEARKGDVKNMCIKRVYKDGTYESTEDCKLK